MRTPEKKPTPNAIIANIAKKRPKDCFISLIVVLLIILLICFLLFRSISKYQCLISYDQIHISSSQSATKLSALAKGADMPTTKFKLRLRLVFIKFSGYHSISSILVTCSLRRISEIRPLFTLITLSAIAVSAELCVITTTVIPVSRHVSCNNLSTALPVT